LRLKPRRAKRVSKQANLVPKNRAGAMSDPLRALLWARGLRDFGDGFVAVLLPVYLNALGNKST
jgi:hypothetical protein